MSTENNTKPLFTITPASSMSSMDAPAVKSLDVTIGMPTSDSTARLVPTPTDEAASQDSRESLLVGRRKESGLAIFSQVSPPFLVAGMGMVLAGIILDWVKDWRVFQEVPEFLVLVTPLLGLKGNLEMTLASRLSTHANLGHMDTLERKWTICSGNIYLIQVQGIVVGFLSSVVAIVIGVILPGEKPFDMKNALLLSSSSIVTAAIASLLLGLLMVGVIFLSRKFNINPDNVATPIAGTVGDVLTLLLLAYVANSLYSDGGQWFCIGILVVFVLATPLWIYLTYRNEFTRKVLVTGWTPVICAMLISSGGGLILDKAEHKFPPLALYQPVINGVGGNLVSVLASRISTALHRECTPGHLPGDETSVWISPWVVFAKKGVDSVAARVLLGMVIPGHLIFTTVTHLVSVDSQNSFLFIIFYLTAAFIQVAFLLYIAQILIRWLWLKKVDPDTSSIPYLTALGDLIGTAFLFLAFELVHLIQPQ